MKKLLLILMLVSVGCGAINFGSNKKFTVVGNSILADTNVMKSCTTEANNGMRFHNLSVGGYGWTNFDALVNYSKHYAEYLIETDTCAGFITDIGINNSVPGGANYRSCVDDARHLFRFMKVSKAFGNVDIIGEMTPFEASDTFSQKARWYAEVDRKNLIRKEFCASFGELYVETHSAFGENGNINHSLFNADNLHPNVTGSVLLGQLYANASIPTISRTFTNKTFQITVSAPQTSDTLVYDMQLNNITDTNFWVNLHPTGRNLHVLCDGVEMQRDIRDCFSWAQNGMVSFKSTKKFTKLQFVLNNTLIDNDTTIYSSFVRYYPLSEYKSYLTTAIDKGASHSNATIASAKMCSYYNPTQLTVDSARIRKVQFMSGSTTGLKSNSTGLGGLTKFTYEFMIYRPVSWSGNITLGYIGDGSQYFIVLINNELKVYIGALTGFWRHADFMTYFTPNAWHKVTMSFDLTTGTMGLYIDGANYDVTKSGTPAASFPTIADDFYYIGRPSESNYWPTGSCISDIKIYNKNLSSADAYASNFVQTSTLWTPTSSTTGSRWSAYKQAYKSACKQAWR